MKQIKIFFKIKSINVFIILSVATMLLLSAVCFSQEGDTKTISLITYRHRYQYAAYDLVRTNIFKDSNDLNFYVDPTVQSRMHQIRLASVGAGAGQQADLTLEGKIYGTNSEGFYIDVGYDAVPEFLNQTAAAAWPAAIYINSVRTKSFFFMGAMDPAQPIPPLSGKHVYDIAEGMNVVDAEACDVVVISEDQDLVLTKSTAKFDTKVAGVVSEEPKLYMGAIAGLTPVALTGVVKCNVTAENGPIKRGDLLVSSSFPGYAMRADSENIRPGMVIGSALEGLEQDKGKIYILVNQ